MLTATASIVTALASRELDAIDADAIRGALADADQYDERIRADLAAARDRWWRASQEDRARVRAIIRAETPVEVANDLRRLLGSSRRR